MASSASNAPQPQIPPQILQLPREVRNAIYRLVLIHSDPIDIDPAVIHRCRSFLQTCTQVRNEASRMYYHSNTFKMDCSLNSLRDFVKFCDISDKSIVPCIKKLNITWRPTRAYPNGGRMMPGPLVPNIIMLDIREVKNYFDESFIDPQQLAEQLVTRAIPPGGVRVTDPQTTGFAWFDDTLRPKLKKYRNELYTAMRT